MNPLPRIIVIVGPTASGKSAAAIRLAETVGGEIVSADSRLLYKEMDIGTAKPSRKERAAIPHHLIDVVSPSSTLTLAAYKRKALAAIRGVLKRGRVPIVVGGTGLYVKAIVENLEIPEVPPDPKYRAFLAKKGKDWILNEIQKRDPAYAERIGPNPRYATRALEVIRATGKPFGAQQGKGPRIFEALMLGLDPGKDALKRHIARRVEAMFRAGLMKEVRALAKKYSSDLPSMSGIGYRELLSHFRGEVSLAEAKQTIKRNTEQYAKRQMTWWRGMQGVEWHARPETVLKSAKKWLDSAK